MVVAEAVMNIACVGADPLAVVNCLNFGNPEHPEVMWQLSEAVDGMSEACLAFNTPVVGGNVSLYNETNSVDIAPTPVVGVIGMHPTLSEAPPHIGLPPDAPLLLLGQEPDPDVSMGGSRWAWEIGGCKEGSLPAFDLDQAVRTAAFVAESVQKQQLEAVHDVGEGGIAVAAAEMAIDTGVGAQLDNYDNHISMFNESGGRVLVVVSNDGLEEFLEEAANKKVAAKVIGRTGGSLLEFGPAVKVPLDVLTAASFNQLPEALGQGTVSA